MQAFLAVARTGRISAAARRLAVEHTTVSRRLAALEADLGVPLFYRTTTGYLLTPHGKNAVAQAEVMEQAALAVAARAREGSGVAAGIVRVALAPEFASHWLAPNLGRLRAAHPRVRVQILVGTRQRDLSRGEAELAIHGPGRRLPGVVATKAARVAIGLYASKAVAARLRSRVTSLATLRGLPLLAFTAQFPLLQNAQWFEPLLTQAEVALETNSTHALLAAALAGAGVAVLPRFVARTEAELVAVSDPVAEHDVWLIAHPEFRRDPKIRAVADFLKTLAEDLV